MRWHTHHPEPECSGEPIAPLADMSVQEMDAILNLGKGHGTTPFINLFKLLHLNDDAPRSHNVLLETRDSAHGLVFKQRHWRRMEDVNVMLLKCLGVTATAFLHLEAELSENLDNMYFKRFMKLRDLVERTSMGYACVGAEMQKVLNRIRDAIVHFTARRPNLLEYAKADCQLALPLEKIPPVRDIAHWQPGGSRYEVFRTHRETYDIVPP